MRHAAKFQPARRTVCLFLSLLGHDQFLGPAVVELAGTEERGFLHADDALGRPQRGNAAAGEVGRNAAGGDVLGLDDQRELFALALVAVMAVTVGVVVLRSWNAATADPADALKTE